MPNYITPCHFNTSDHPSLLRCVPDSHRSFALGLQWIVIRLLGTIPGPILFGALFDHTCVLWQNHCGREGACKSYDNFYMSRCVREGLCVRVWRWEEQKWEKKKDWDWKGMKEEWIADGEKKFQREREQCLCVFFGLCCSISYHLSNAKVDSCSQSFVSFSG